MWSVYSGPQTVKSVKIKTWQSKRQNLWREWFFFLFLAAVTCRQVEAPVAAVSGSEAQLRIQACLPKTVHWLQGMDVCESVWVDRQHLNLSPVFWLVCWASLTCYLYICASTKVAWYKCMCMTLGIKMTLWSTWAASNSEKSNSSQLKGRVHPKSNYVVYLLQYYLSWLFGYELSRL